MLFGLYISLVSYGRQTVFGLATSNRGPIHGCAFLKSQVHTTSFTNKNLHGIMETFKRRTKFKYEL